MAGRFWLKHLKSAPVDVEDDGGRDFQGFNFNFKNCSQALEGVDSEIQFCFLAAASALLSVRSFASIELVFLPMALMVSPAEARFAAGLRASFQGWRVLHYSFS